MPLGKSLHLQEDSSVNWAVRAILKSYLRIVVNNGTELRKLAESMGVSWLFQRPDAPNFPQNSLDKWAAVGDNMTFIELVA